MTNSAFSTIANRVEALVPQVPRPTVIEHMRRAARTACQKTLAWRHVPAKTTLLPGVFEYAFTVPEQAEVEHIFAVSMNGSRMEYANLDVAISRYPEWAELYSGEDPEVLWSLSPTYAIGHPLYNEALFADASGFVLPDAIVAAASRPRMVTGVSQQRFIVLPLPDAEETYELRFWLALKPEREATEMDTQAFEELEDSIVYGALETLFAMPNKTWTNPEYSVHYGSKFREECLEKRRRANLGHVRGPMSVRSARWL